VINYQFYRTHRLIAWFFIFIMTGFVFQSQPAFAKYASLVIDADTGEMLHASHIDDRNHPASLTKIMTLYLLFDDIDAGLVHFNDRFTVSAHAAIQAPSKLDLSEGDTVRVEDLMYAIITKSANDAAVTVAENLNGTEALFAQRMTKKARELGMKVTEFHNASGLPNPKQISSARDMATLARALLHNHAKYYHFFSTRQFTYQGVVMNNHNHLMERYEGMDGIKTGYVAASGFNLVASTKRNGRRLIGVVFGGASAVSRDQHMANLLDASFTKINHKNKNIMDQSLTLDETGDEIKTIKEEKSNFDKTPVAAVPDKKVKNDPKIEKDEDSWAIQVGSFSSYKSAQLTAKENYANLGTLTADGDPKVIKIKSPHSANKVLWQARVVNLSQSQAKQACKRLVKKHKECHVVKEIT
jgi:D-alanyl-D-alanine carboxypeptidase